MRFFGGLGTGLRWVVWVGGLWFGTPKKWGLCPDSVARKVFQVFQVVGGEEERENKECISNLIRSIKLVHICLNVSPPSKHNQCYNFRRLRQLSTVVVSKVRSQMSLEECKSWTCIVLLGLRVKVQVKGLSIKD